MDPRPPTSCSSTIPSRSPWSREEALGAGKWIWRCHIDFTDPQPEVWDFLKGYVERYDAAVFSAPAFSRPSGDPAGPHLPLHRPAERQEQGSPRRARSTRVCARFGIDRGRPIVTQISRFDYLKDPVGVIRAYKMVKEHVDCQLVLAGGGATDDPEGMQVLDEVRDGRPRTIRISSSSSCRRASDIEINALQRASRRRPPEILEGRLRPDRGRGPVEGEARHRLGRRRHPPPDRPQVFRDPDSFHRGDRLLDQAAAERAANTPDGLGANGRHIQEQFSHHPPHPGLPAPLPLAS